MKRKQRTIAKPCRKLTMYHFTNHFHMPSIENSGLNRGDVATSPFGGYNAVWLTTDPNPEAQGWSNGGINKTAIRITVDIPDTDAHLIK